MCNFSTLLCLLCFPVTFVLSVFVFLRDGEKIVHYVAQLLRNHFINPYTILIQLVGARGELIFLSVLTAETV